MGKEWFKTPEQRVFLKSKVDDYIAARADRRQEPFRKSLVGEWMNRWSEQTAIFDKPTPDSPPLTKDQLEQLGKAVEKRSEVRHSNPFPIAL